MFAVLFVVCVAGDSVQKQSGSIFDDQTVAAPVLASKADFDQFTPQYNDGIRSCNANRLPNSVELRGLVGTKDPDAIADAHGCPVPYVPFNNYTSNFSLRFVRGTVSPEPSAAGLYNMRNRAHVTRRGLAFPQYTACDNEKTLCIPGPCAMWDVDYLLASHRIDPQTRQVQVDNSRRNASLPFDMVGTPHCGPSFGVQMFNRDTKVVVPSDNDLRASRTASVFPTRMSTFVTLYSPLAGSLEVPLPNASNTNSNPLWYYRLGSETNRLYGTADVLEPLVCTTKTRAPYVLPDSSVNIENGVNGLINLGWGNSSFQWNPSSVLDTLQNKDGAEYIAMNYQQGIFDDLTIDTFRTITQTSHYVFPPSGAEEIAPLNGTGNSTFVTHKDYTEVYDWLVANNRYNATGSYFSSLTMTDPRRTMFMVPQLIPHTNGSNRTNQIDVDAFQKFFKMDEMCDLTQCSWTPQTEEKGIGPTWREQALNCMYAEMIQFFISRINVDWITEEFETVQANNLFPLPLYCLKPRKPYSPHQGADYMTTTLASCLQKYYNKCNGVGGVAHQPFESGGTAFPLCNFNKFSQKFGLPSPNGPNLAFSYESVQLQFDACKAYVYSSDCTVDHRGARKGCAGCPMATPDKRRRGSVGAYSECWADPFFNPTGGSDSRNLSTTPPVDPNWGQPTPHPLAQRRPIDMLERDVMCPVRGFTESGDSIKWDDTSVTPATSWMDLYMSMHKGPFAVHLRSTVESLVDRKTPSTFGCRPKRIFSGNPDRAKRKASRNANTETMGSASLADTMNGGDPNTNVNNLLYGKASELAVAGMSLIYGPLAFLPGLVHDLRSTKGVTGVNVAAQTYNPQRRALCHPNAAHTLSIGDNTQWKDKHTHLTCYESMRSHDKAADPNQPPSNIPKEEYEEKCGFVADAIHQYRTSDVSSRDSHIARLWLTTAMCYTNTQVDDDGLVKMVNTLMETDMNIDSWAMPASPPGGDPDTSEGHYVPQPWAMSPINQWVSAPIALNGSFLNSQSVVDSQACDCGSALPMYKLVGGPWAEAKALFGWGDLAPYQLPNTWITEAGMGWDRNVDTITSESPIGLYIPSNSRWSPNFTTYERDVLLPSSPASTAATLLNETFMGYNAPEEAKLETLLFDPKKGPWANVAGDRPTYTVTRITYKYGSCMRYPYGQLPRASMTAAAQSQHFTKPNADGTEYFVAEEALIGYCETFHANLTDAAEKGRYAFCANDGMSADGRDTFCRSPGAARIVVGATINAAQSTVDHACDKVHKTCIVVPGAPHMFPSVTKLLQSAYNFAGYTVLITPFNWTVAKAFMAPARRYYDVGREKNIADNMMPLNDADYHTTGMEALTAQEFMLFANNTQSVEGIQSLVASIDIKLKRNNNRICKTRAGTTIVAPEKCYNLPWVSSRNLTEDDIYPPQTEYNIPIAHSHLTVVSALATRKLTYVSAKAKHGSSHPCTQFLVSAPGFRLYPTIIDQTGCENVTPLYKTAITYGGPDVSDSHVDITTFASPMPVAIVGDDTSSFVQTSIIAARNVTIRIAATDANDIRFAVGVVRAAGDIAILYSNTSGQPASAIIQPLRGNRLTLTGVDHIVNISKYNDIYGDAELKRVYAEHIVTPTQLELSVYYTLLGANAIMLLKVVDNTLVVPAHKPI